jgi:DNA-binding LytR/AlgR family response regulator
MIALNCLIVDDEPIARSIIETYCAHLPYLNVVGSCGNAIEAKLILQKENIDILFLDINMPLMDGISFLRTMKNPPQVIFTTAYKEFAVDAFDLSACDYLLKPFSFERFVVAIDKAVEKLNPVALSAEHSSPKSPDFIFIRTDGKIFKILFSDLLYAEASGNYTKIVTATNTYLPALTFSGVEEMLTSSDFIRVHRSFIINKRRINHIEGNRVYIGKTEIPIGSNYKDAFLKSIGLQ